MECGRGVADISTGVDMLMDRVVHALNKNITVIAMLNNKIVLVFILKTAQNISVNQAIVIRLSRGLCSYYELSQSEISKRTNRKAKGIKIIRAKRFIFLEYVAGSDGGFVAMSLCSNAKSPDD